MNTMAPTRPTELHVCRVRLTAQPAAAPEARSQVLAAIRAWHVPVDPGVAVLLTSELVTNAIGHEAGQTVTLAVHGHEKVPTGGQFQVPVFGRLEVPAPRVSCPGRAALYGDGVGVSQIPVTAQELLLKNARERMDILAAYREVGSYRGAAAICGTTHKTVKRVVQRHDGGGDAPQRKDRGHNYDEVRALVTGRVAKSFGRISAKRLLPAARAAGYAGSARNFRRLVAQAKAAWRAGHHRGRRPAVWTPGDTLVIDWGSESRLHVFCAVLAWSRFRFVRFAADEKAATTLALLAECFEVLGGVPKTVLADRMGCLKAGVVANVVVPTAEYVRFAAHYGFRPDFCEAADPESKGIVEHLVGYAKRDLIVPAEPSVTDLPAANIAAATWCAEVNAVVHSEICAVPAGRLEQERALLGPLPSLRPDLGARPASRKVDKLSCVRFGSARYSVPSRLIGTTVLIAVAGTTIRILEPFTGEIAAEHQLVPPGETSITDAHYGSARPDRPRRAPRAKTAAEKQFLALGEPAAAFLTGAAAAGVSSLAREVGEILTLRAAHGDAAVAAALRRAVQFRRWRADDVRSILAAAGAAPDPRPAGQALVLTLPAVPVRPLSDYAIGGEDQ